MRRPLLRALIAISHAIALASMFATARVARAQGILLAPTAIVIDDRSKSGAVTMVNPGNSTVEVTISTAFGYPATDSAGVMYLRQSDGVIDTTNSAASWLRLFPARLRLAPGERRTVRMMIAPPDSLTDGEHWARLVVASRIVSATGAPVTDLALKPVGADSAATSGDVQLGLSMEIRAMLPLFYRHGKPATGLTMGTPRLQIEPDSLAARIAIRRTGNAAFIGSLRATLVDAAGAVVRTGMLPLGVYYDLDPRIALGTNTLVPGSYSLTIEAIAQRGDVPNNLVLPSSTSATSTMRATIEVPSRSAPAGRGAK